MKAVMFLRMKVDLRNTEHSSEDDLLRELAEVMHMASNAVCVPDGVSVRPILPEDVAEFEGAGLSITNIRLIPEMDDLPL